MDLTTVTSFRRATTRDDLRLTTGETLLGGGTWLMSAGRLTGLWSSARGTRFLGAACSRAR